MLCGKELDVIAVIALDPHDEKDHVPQGPQHQVPALRETQDAVSA